jgi:hypothetical protein
VNIHEARLRRHVEAQLDIREEQFHVGEPTGGLVLEKFFVGLGDVVVGDGDCLDPRRQAFEGREIGNPWVGGAELIVEDGAGRMDMRLPSVPFRTATDHAHP